MTAREDADALIYRQAVDVIRDENEVVEPTLDEDGKPIEEPTAEAIIEQGIDPQLETALIWLKLQELPNIESGIPVLKSANVTSDKAAE